MRTTSQRAVAVSTATLALSLATSGVASASLLPTPTPTPSPPDIVKTVVGTVGGVAGQVTKTLGQSPQPSSPSTPSKSPARQPAAKPAAHRPSSSATVASAPQSWLLFGGSGMSLHLPSSAPWTWRTDLTQAPAVAAAPALAGPATPTMPAAQTRLVRLAVDDPRTPGGGPLRAILLGLAAAAAVGVAAGHIRAAGVRL